MQNKWSAFGVGVTVLLLTVALFANTLLGTTVAYLDSLLVFENPLIKSFSTANLQQIFAAPFAKTHTYEPLSYLTHAWIFRIWQNVHFYHHLANLSLHLLNSVLVLWLLLRMSNRLTVAALITLLFAFHPFCSETVSFILGRSQLLMATFYLFALLAYVAYKQKSNIVYYLLSIVFFGASVLAQPAALTLPVALLLTDRYLGLPLAGKGITEKIPFLLIALTFLAVLAYWQNPDLMATTVWAKQSLLQRVVLSLYALFWYAFKSVLPFGMSNFYEYPTQTEWWHYLGIAILVLLGLANRQVQTAKLAVNLGLGLFFLAILPSLPIFPTTSLEFIADRHAYLAHLWIWFALVHWLTNATTTKDWAVPLLGVFVIGFGTIAYKQNNIWRDAVTFWTNAMQKNPQSAYTNFYLGDSYALKGDFTTAKSYLDKAVIFDTNFGMAYEKRGLCKFNLADYANALNDYNRAVKLMPKSVEAFAGRGSTKAALQRYQDAIVDFNEAIAINAQYWEAYMNRGKIKTALKDWGGAENDYTKVIELNPYVPEAFFQRGIGYTNMKNFTKACQDFRAAYNAGYRSEQLDYILTNGCIEVKTQIQGNTDPLQTP